MRPRKPGLKVGKEKLKLRKETLRSLSEAELAKVPGAGSKWIGGKYYPCDPRECEQEGD